MVAHQRAATLQLAQTRASEPTQPVEQGTIPTQPLPRPPEQASTSVLPKLPLSNSSFQPFAPNVGSQPGSQVGDAVSSYTSNRGGNRIGAGRPFNSSALQTRACTSSGSSLLVSESTGQESTILDSTTPEYFVCEECNVARAVYRRLGLTNQVCEYGLDVPIREQMKFCIDCRQEKPREEFYDERDLRGLEFDP